MSLSPRRSTASVGELRSGQLDVEVRAGAAGYRLARRTLRGQPVWWWQVIADPDDTRQPFCLERRQALSFMEDMLDRLAIAP